jgi:putative membrane protein
MTKNKLLRRLSLSEKDLIRIKEAVADAEKRTNGEIALAATGESSDYSFFELFAAVILGAVCFALMLVFNSQIEAIVGRFFWQEKNWYLPALFGFAEFAVIAVFYCVANIGFIDRIVIPWPIRKARVHNRALRHFVESGVYATKDRTGILVFVSCMEREVRIVADSGINAKIEQKEWDELAQMLAQGIREKKTATALVEVISKCGDLLEKEFPAKEENPNEHPDGLVILEAGE